MSNRETITRLNLNIAEAVLKFAIAEIEDQRLRAEDAEAQNEAIRAKLLEMERLAGIDPKTEVYNHRGFIKAYNNSRADRIRATGKEVDLHDSIIMLDVDGFKEINDSLGHDKGDAVLWQLSRTLESKKRQNDILGRFGGDEFCLVLPETPLVGAIKFTEGLYSAMNNFQVDGTPITISMGVAEIVDGNLTLGLKNADQALYLAKDRGKDQFAAYEA